MMTPEDITPQHRGHTPREGLIVWFVGQEAKEVLCHVGGISRDEDLVVSVHNQGHAVITPFR